MSNFDVSLESSTDVANVPRLESVYVAKQAMAAIQLPHGVTLGSDFFAALAETLDRDHRVEVLRRPARQDAVDHSHYFPYMITGNAQPSLQGRDSFISPKAQSPIIFRVDVPDETAAKVDFGEATLYEGPYFVAWDGNSLVAVRREPLVILDASGHPSAVPVSTYGRAESVLDVVRQAARESGAEVFIQACERSCGNGFIHTDAFLVRPGLGGLVAPQPGRRVYERDWADQLGEAVVAEWFEDLDVVLSGFHRLKNQAARLKDLIAFIGVHLTTLLTLQQRHFAAEAEPLMERVKARWKMRGWRRESRSLVGDIWIASAQIEVLKRAWEHEGRLHDTGAGWFELSNLFELDLGSDAANIREYDSELTRSALDSFTTRLDSRSVVFATAAAGVAGIGGAVLGAFLAS